MREDVLDLLMYIFEYRLDDDNDEDPGPNEVREQLQEAGFRNSDIDRALEWLNRLVHSDILVVQEGSKLAQRVFTPIEQQVIGLESLGFLVFLEQNGLLNATLRELIIDQVMELDTEEIDTDQFRWVILMVLFNQPEDDIAYSRIEEFVMGEPRIPSGVSLH